MKPKPFSALNHFTVPSATCAPTFVRADDPASGGGTGLLALPPVEHERGTRTARDGTAQGAWIRYIHARLVTGSGEQVLRPGAGGVLTLPPVVEGQPIRPASRTERSDGCTRWVGPTTGSSGSSVLSPSPVLRTTVSLAGSSRPSSTSWRSTAIVTPPAVSAKIPVVRARSRMPCTISSSPTRPTEPPVRRMASSADGPAAGVPAFRG